MTLSKSADHGVATIHTSHTVIPEYPIPGTGALSEANHTLKHYLNHNGKIAISPEKLEKIIITTELASKAFDELTAEQEQFLIEVRDMLLPCIKHESYTEILKDEKRKKLYQKLIEIFIGTLCNKEVYKLSDDWAVISKNPSTSRKLPEETNCLLPLEGKDEFHHERVPLIDKISHFMQILIRDYLSYVFPSSSGNALGPFEEYFKTNFEYLFPKAMPHLFFGPHGKLTTTQQDLLECIMGGVHHFFDSFTQIEKMLIKKDKGFTKKPFAERELLLLEHLYERIISKKDSPLATEGPVEERVLAHFSELLQRIFHHIVSTHLTKPEEQNVHIQSFFLFISSTALTKFLFEQLISPHLFCVIIDNLCLHNVNIDIDEAPPVKKGKKRDSNAKFKKALGDCAENLCRDLCYLGEAEGVMKTVPSAVGKFSEQIGEMIEAQINETLNTECLLKTLLIVKETLYDEDEKPIMREAMQMSEEEKLEYHKKIEQGLKTRLYDVIEDQIPAVLSFLLTEQFNPFKTFCATLTRKLFEITQSPGLFRILSYHILESIYHGLLEAALTDDKHS